MRVLVAGATGVLGREVVRVLAATSAARVTILSRRPDAPVPPVAAGVVTGDVLRPETLVGCCAGIDIVVSTIGASLDVKAVRDRSSYARVDHLGNRALLEEARRAGARRFVFVSVFATPRLSRLEYVAAHERFVHDLRDSGLPHAVIRPTGFFSFMGDVLTMARQGRGLVIGDGAARTNPVHEADVAEAVVEATLSPNRRIQVDIGGPDVLTRREIVELAFRAVGREPRILAAPPTALRMLAAGVRPLNPRLGALLRFGVEVSLEDVIGPALGRRRLADYFESAGRG